MDKCQMHDDVKSEVVSITHLLQSQILWQAKFEERMDSLVEATRVNAEAQKDIQGCLNQLSVQLAKNYVTKIEFEKMGDESEKRIVRVHQRLDQMATEQKENLWKVIGFVFPAGALVFAFIQWVVAM